MIEEIKMRIKMIKLILVLALGAVICLPGMAMAWSQAINETYGGPYDALEAFITGGATDFSSAMSNMASGWTGSLDAGYPDYTSGIGPSVTNMNFTLNFTADKSVPFTMDLLAWDGGILSGTMVDAAHATWSGSGWSFKPFTTDGTGYERPAAAVVPIPCAALLVGTGLLGLGFVPFRRKKTEV
jgi:hypothetical protein